MVGLVTLDNDNAQALLKADQAAVVEQSGQVHALAGRIYQEHEEYQSHSSASNGGGAAAAAAEDDSTGFQRRGSEEQVLMNKLDYGLGEASPEVRTNAARAFGSCGHKPRIYSHIYMSCLR